KRGARRREISPATLLAALREAQQQCASPILGAYLEVAQPMPRQGVSSTFKFGRGYGCAETVITAMGWPLTYVSAAAWKKTMVAAADKDQARSRASQLLPLDTRYWTPRRGQLNKAQAAGNAEAALIGLYGLRRFGGVKFEHAA